MLEGLADILRRDDYGGIECHIYWNPPWDSDAPISGPEVPGRFCVVVEDTVGCKRVEAVNADLSVALNEAVLAARSMPVRQMRSS